VSIRFYLESGLKKTFSKIPKQNQQQIIDKISLLSKSPLKQPQVKRIVGTQNGHRLRVGRWRVLFALENQTIDIVDIFMEKNKKDYEVRIKLLK